MSVSLQTLAEQNDAFRRGSHALPGERVHTRGIEALGLEAVLHIWSFVRGFDGFNEDNDPYGEHDFGSFIHPFGGKVFWKIDLKYGSEDPADPAKTKRVLTVMLASEY
jgi:hypothetical protein